MYDYMGASYSVPLQHNQITRSHLLEGKISGLGQLQIRNKTLNALLLNDLELANLKSRHE